MIDFYVLGALAAGLLARRALKGTQQRFARAALALMGVGALASLGSVSFAIYLTCAGLALASLMSALELSWSVKATWRLWQQTRG